MSDTLIALFNPGDSQVNVSLLVKIDQIFELTEVFLFNLSVSTEFSNINERLLIKPGANNIAEGKIVDSNGVYSIVTSIITFSYFLVLVNFTADSYRADVNANSVVVNVTAFGSYDTPFTVKVIPYGADLSVGGMLLILNIDHIANSTVLF